MVEGSILYATRLPAFLVSTANMRIFHNQLGGANDPLYLALLSPDPQKDPKADGRNRTGDPSLRDNEDGDEESE